MWRGRCPWRLQNWHFGSCILPSFDIETTHRQCGRPRDADAQVSHEGGQEAALTGRLATRRRNSNLLVVLHGSTKQHHRQQSIATALHEWQYRISGPATPTSTVTVPQNDSCKKLWDL